jgi:isopenicillin N synthase-like dioxygenase
MGITTEVPKTVQWNGKQVPVYPMQTVDFSQLLSQEPAEIEKLVRCCQTEGFFYIDLQGIDGRRMLDDQQETLALMHRFFESPLEVKNEYGLVSPHLGYEPVGSRTGVLENTKDGYEMIKVSYLSDTVTIRERHVNSVHRYPETRSKETHPTSPATSRTAEISRSSKTPSLAPTSSPRPSCRRSQLG